MFARAKVELIPLGSFPTPVEHLETLSTSQCDLWVKRDDLTHAVYGGNKVRKLEHLLAVAKAANATRIVTVGGAGSHHVLATTYFGALAGIAVEAVLVPQPRTDHVVDVLRAGLALGLRAFPVRSWASAPFVIARHIAKGSRFIPVGGSSVDGAMGYVAAARELAQQIRSGALPEPDLCVVALGSGGTAAGLAAGFALEGLKTRVVGVCVSRPVAFLRVSSFALAWACARRERLPSPFASLRRRMAVDARFLGKGYGYPTTEGDEASRIANGAGLTLDSTYTAKTFAAALSYVQGGGRDGARSVLYWHTLASGSMQPFLAQAPSEYDLEPHLRRLLLPSRGKEEIPTKLAR